MGWNEQYWEVVSNFYWAPRYLGFKSIPKKKWIVDDQNISIPRLLVPPTSERAYFREVKSNALQHLLEKQEEILNHVFSLVMSIVGDQIVSKLLCEPLSIADGGPFERLQKNLRPRFRWPEDNVTQPDGLFLSQTSWIAVELKLGSSSWPEQIGKYISLALWEELYSGPRKDIGLLFIVPEKSIPTHWSKVGLQSANIPKGYLDHLNQDKLPKTIRTLFASERARAESIAMRLKLRVISWAEFHALIEGVEKSLNTSNPGDQTLSRLLAGLRDQMAGHKQAGMQRSFEQEFVKALARFNPTFARDFNSGGWTPAVGEGTPESPMTMPGYDYGLAAMHFIDVVNGFALRMPDFDWPKWAETPEAVTLRSDPQAIALADALQLAKLAITIVRADRFSEGSFAKAIETGLVRAITARAEALTV